MCQNGHILLFIYNYFVIGNHFRVLFAILTNINITGTSTSTPTTVANAAPDCKPNREIATATANSKKFKEITCSNHSGRRSNIMG